MASASEAPGERMPLGGRRRFPSCAGAGAAEGGGVSHVRSSAGRSGGRARSVGNCAKDGRTPTKVGRRSVDSDRSFAEMGQIETNFHRLYAEHSHPKFWPSSPNSAVCSTKVFESSTTWPMPCRRLAEFPPMLAEVTPPLAEFRPILGIQKNMSEMRPRLVKIPPKMADVEICPSSGQLRTNFRRIWSMSAQLGQKVRRVSGERPPSLAGRFNDVRRVDRSNAPALDPPSRPPREDCTSDLAEL